MKEPLLHTIFAVMYRAEVRAASGEALEARLDDAPASGLLVPAGIYCKERLLADCITNFTKVDPDPKGFSASLSSLVNPIPIPHIYSCICEGLQRLGRHKWKMRISYFELVCVYLLRLGFYVYTLYNYRNKSCRWGHNELIKII